MFSFGLDLIFASLKKIIGKGRLKGYAIKFLNSLLDPNKALDELPCDFVRDEYKKAREDAGVPIIKDDPVEKLIKIVFCGGTVKCRDVTLETVERVRRPILNGGKPFEEQTVSCRFRVCETSTKGELEVGGLCNTHCKKLVTIVEACCCGDSVFLVEAGLKNSKSLGAEKSKEPVFTIL